MPFKVSDAANLPGAVKRAIESLRQWIVANYLTLSLASSTYVTLATGPRGVVGVHTLTTVFTTTGTHTTFQDEGLTLTRDEVAGRRWKFTLAVAPYVPGGANTVQYRLLRDGVAIQYWDVASTALSTVDLVSMTLTYTEAIAVTHAASVFKVQIKGFVNTAVNSYGDGSHSRQLVIEDIGS